MWPGAGLLLFIGLGLGQGCLDVTPTPPTASPPPTFLGSPIYEEAGLIVLWSDVDIAAKNFKDHCVLVGVVARVNGQFDCNFGVLYGEPKDMLLHECVDKGGNRFNTFTMKVVNCEVSVKRPSKKRGCLVP